MKFIISMFFLIFSNFALADGMCKHGDHTSLVENWKLFRHSSLNEQPEKIAKYYLFPLKLYSPTDSHGRDEKPIVIAKKIFLKNYSLIFKKNTFNNEEVHLFTELKKITAGDYIKRIGFDQFGCSYQGVASIEDYQFIWSEKNGWQIESISYIGYGDLLELFKNNDILK
jgi:hypothetical protein